MSINTPHMSEAEANLFYQFARSSKSYFEFGMGGSTVQASSLVDGRLVAVDSDLAWVNNTSKAIEPSRHERSLIHIDIGPTKKWGYPIDTSNSEIFLPYYQSITHYKPQEFDFCLVDGRFRVACFLTALKHTRVDTVIAMHDYRGRGEYHVVENFARIIVEVEEISFFIRKQSVDLQALENMLETYSANPG